VQGALSSGSFVRFISTTTHRPCKLFPRKKIYVPIRLLTIDSNSHKKLVAEMHENLHPKEYSNHDP
jgi:hypothetical protein